MPEKNLNSVDIALTSVSILVSADLHDKGALYQVLTTKLCSIPSLVKARQQKMIECAGSFIEGSAT